MLAYLHSSREHLWSSVTVDAESAESVPKAVPNPGSEYTSVGEAYHHRSDRSSVRCAPTHVHPYPPSAVRCTKMESRSSRRTDSSPKRHLPSRPSIAGQEEGE